MKCTSGLLTYCLNNKAQCMECEDLVKIAKRKGGISLLVDMWTFGFCLREWFATYIVAKTNNNNLPIIDEELNTLEEYITAFLSKLSAVGISLVWIIDAEKAESLDLLETKIPRLKQRHTSHMQVIGELMQVCNGEQKNERFPYEGMHCSILSLIQLECIVRRYGCDVIQCSHEDGDLLMVKRLVSDEKVHALLSNDSDFMIFDGSSYIPTSIFDYENNLHLSDETMTTDHMSEPIPQLKVGRLSTRKICEHFKFTEQKMMVDLSILKGNGFTCHLIQKYKILKSLITCNKTALPELASWVATCNVHIENISVVKNALRRYPELQTAIDGSRTFYDSSRPLPTVYEPGTYGYFIVKRVENHSLPPDVVSILNGFYWRILVVEQHLETWPCVEAALSPLRRYIYRMVLPPNVSQVKEFGRGLKQQFDIATVNVSDVKVMNLQEVQEENRAENLETFHWIMTHMERDDADRIFELCNPQYKVDFNISLGLEDDTDASIENYFTDHAEKTAFVMYLLRYMLVLNWRQNLSIGTRDFLALTAVVLRDADDSRYQTLDRCPRPDTVSMCNWFLDIYRHAYSYLARSLYLTSSFPEPKEIFCGSAWIAFHACCDAQNDGADDLVEAKAEIRRVLLANVDIIEHVTRGYISFNHDTPFLEKVNHDALFTLL